MIQLHILGQRLKSQNRIVEVFSWTPRLRQTAEPHYALNQLARIISGTMTLSFRHNIPILFVSETPFGVTYEYDSEYADLIVFPPTVSALVQMPQPRKHGECVSCIHHRRGVCTLFGHVMKKKVYACHAWIEDIRSVCKEARIHVEA